MRNFTNDTTVDERRIDRFESSDSPGCEAVPKGRGVPKERRPLALFRIRGTAVACGDARRKRLDARHALVLNVPQQPRKLATPTLGSISSKLAINPSLGPPSVAGDLPGARGDGHDRPGIRCVCGSRVSAVRRPRQDGCDSPARLTEVLRAARLMLVIPARPAAVGANGIFERRH
jgi:hypothetical protein